MRVKIITKPIIALIFLALLTFSFFEIKNFLLKKKNDILSNLPKVAQLKEQILNPGPLRGPVKLTRASKLDIKEIIKWTNFYRDQEHLPPLTENQILDLVSDNKTNDMFEKQYFDHISPDGKSVADQVKTAGYRFKMVGENLALGDFKNEKELVDAWMASPGHRANILNKDFKEIGVSAKLGQYQGRTTWISVQTFATPAPSCPLPDAKLKKEIDLKIAQSNQVSQLLQEGNRLIEQGNFKIEEGNRIYKETGDRSLAETYWKEGENLQNQGQEKINQAKTLQFQIQDLSSLISRYNKQVDTYNRCLTQ